MYITNGAVELAVISKMKQTIPRIKLSLEGKELQAFYAISADFKDCGRAGKIDVVMNDKEQKNFKFNDEEFLCVYSAICRSLGSSRYPTKSGNEYIALCNIKEYFQGEYYAQRNKRIECL